MLRVKKIYPTIHKSVMDLEDSIRAAANISKFKDNLVRVAATSVVSTNILPKVIAQLKRSHPLIEIELRDVDRASIHQLVEAGEVDVGLGLSGHGAQHLKKMRIGTCGLLMVGQQDAQQDLPETTEDLQLMQGKAIYAHPLTTICRCWWMRILWTKAWKRLSKTAFRILIPFWQ